ncbi:MAG TPA: hypothetical protein VJM83_02500, partial [Nitrospirota bacterium]|nr:hypothetical protein [Nitrospirota bacterium]
MRGRHPKRIPRKAVNRDAGATRRWFAFMCVSVTAHALCLGAMSGILPAVFEETGERYVAV